jgi:hypothetical protein
MLVTLYTHTSCTEDNSTKCDRALGIKRRRDISVILVTLKKKGRRRRIKHATTIRDHLLSQIVDGG